MVTCTCFQVLLHYPVYITLRVYLANNEPIYNFEAQFYGVLIVVASSKYAKFCLSNQKKKCYVHFARYFCKLFCIGSFY